MPLTHAPAPARPAGRTDRAVGGLLLAAALFGAVVLLATVSFETQIAVLVFAVIVAAAFPLARLAARADGAISAAYLGTALAVKLGAALLRFGVLQTAYGGVGDASGYHGAGLQTYSLVRTLDFGFLQPPFLGTNAIKYLTGFVYAVIGPSMAAGFLVFATASFLGQWWFYRAYRVGFPDGNHRLYAALVFFLPSLVYWPSSIGKDAVMVLGLGLAAYGLARLARRLSVRAFGGLAAGLAIVTVVRPPIGAIVGAGAAIAFLLGPATPSRGVGRALAWVIGVPVVLALAVLLVTRTSSWLGVEGIGDAFELYEVRKEGLNSGGSGFVAPDPSDPLGAAGAVLTALLRPLPGEVAGPLGILAGLESAGLAVLLLFRLRVVGRTLGRWRDPVVAANLLIVLGFVAVLTGFQNFGLLVRQRASLLPFLAVFLAGAGIAGRLRESLPRPI